MTILWGSLYSRSVEAQTLAAVLRDSLTTLGYTLYDPFALMPGKSYRQTVRLFVAPPADGWTRVVGVVEKAMLASLSQMGLCLYAELNDSGAVVEAWENGEVTNLESALKPFARCGDLEKRLRGEVQALAESPSSVFDMLTDDPQMQSLSSRVNPQQAQKMFDRLSGGLMKKAGADVGDSNLAQSIMNSAPDWDSAGGAQIRALMECLKLDYREPDFNTLRDAYQLYTRRQRNPNARLYPGDEDTMKRVPHALDYIPVYGGR